MGATLTRRGLGFKAVDMGTANLDVGRLFGRGIPNFTVTVKRPIGWLREGVSASGTYR